MMKGNPCAETTKLLPKCHIILQLFDTSVAAAGDKNVNKRCDTGNGARLLHHAVALQIEGSSCASGNRSGAPALGHCTGSASTQYRG